MLSTKTKTIYTAHCRGLTSTYLNQEGVSIIFSILILSILLAISLGISTILVGQTRMLKGMEDSMQSFFAADTGIERALFELSGPGVIQDALPNGAEYRVERIDSGGDCSGVYYCLKSVGSFRKTKRAMEVIR